MSESTAISLSWFGEMLQHESYLVRRAVAETLGGCAIRDRCTALIALAQLKKRGLTATGWLKRDLEHLALDESTLDAVLDMAGSIEFDRHKLALELLLLHPAELLFHREKEILRLPDLTRTEHELIRETIAYYRQSSEALWDRAQVLTTAMSRYPNFPRRLKDTLRVIGRELATRPYPQIPSLVESLERKTASPWMEGFISFLLAAKQQKQYAPLILDCLVLNEWLPHHEMMENALVRLGDYGLIDRIVDDFPLKPYRYRRATSSLFHRLPCAKAIAHASQLAEGETDSIAYSLRLTYCRAFDQKGLQKNYEIARLMPETSELSFLGVESLGYAQAIAMPIPDQEHWLAEAEQVGLLEEDDDDIDQLRHSMGAHLMKQIPALEKFF